MRPTRVSIPSQLTFVAIASVVSGCTPSFWLEDIGDGCARAHRAPDDVVTSITCGIADGCSLSEAPDGALVRTVCPLDGSCISITEADGATMVSCSGTMQNT